MSETEDYFLYEPKFDGTVKGNLKNRATGYHVQFGSPSTDELWNFDLEHKNMEFESNWVAETEAQLLSG
jgi:hypothetical protein